MNMQLIDINDKSSCSVARGIRLKAVRLMAGLSRSVLQDKYGISAHTLQSWEKAKAGGLTQKGAFRMLNVLKQEGIHCSLEWLLYGIGQPAKLRTSYIPLNKQSIESVSNYFPFTKATANKNIINELLVFRSLNQQAIDYMVEDDGLSPFYLPGDYVAGKKRFGSAISHLIGKDCIVQTTTNEVLLRRILRSKQPGSYSLTCINTNTSIIEYIRYDQELISAAPVVWHRRPE